MAITEWTDRVQRNTLAYATRHGDGWTVADLAFVEEAGGKVSDEAIALTLGRTLFSIQTIRHAIRAGKAQATTRQARVRAGEYRGWMEGDGDE